MANSRVLERRFVCAHLFFVCCAVSDILSRTPVSDTWSRTSLDSHVLGQNRMVSDTPLSIQHLMCRSQAGPDHCSAAGGDHPGQPYLWPTTKLPWGSRGRDWGPDGLPSFHRRHWRRATVRDEALCFLRGLAASAVASFRFYMFPFFLTALSSDPTSATRQTAGGTTDQHRFVLRKRRLTAGHRSLQNRSREPT